MKRRLKALVVAVVIILSLVLAGCGGVNAITLSSSKAQISVEVPKGWVVESQATLVKKKLVPKGLPYVGAASSSGVPSNEIFGPSPQLWLLVTVETVPANSNPPGPGTLYEIMLADLEQLGFTSFTPLTDAHDIKQGGLTGSAVAAQANSSSGSESFYELVYTNKHETKLWIVVVGGSSATYSKDINTVKAIIASVKVGSAA